MKPKRLGVVMSCLALLAAAYLASMTDMERSCALRIGDGLSVKQCVLRAHE